MSIYITHVPVGDEFERDLEYDLVPPAVPVITKKGRQCGLCGMKFDYNTHYGFWCARTQCPMGHHINTSLQGVTNGG